MAFSRKVTKCLFPVAGLGTRFLPATKETPKEMLPLIDRPIIHYGVEEAVSSGCGDVIFVTGRGKRSIEDYFDRSWELEDLLERRGKDDLCRLVRDITQMARFSYVRQSEPLGLGHAVLCGELMCQDGPFGVILPDDVMRGDPPVMKQLIDVHECHGGSVIALEEVSPEDTSRYGIVAADDVGNGVFRLKDMVEKPVAGRAPSRYAIMGRYVLSPTIFEELRSLNPGAGGEYQLTDALRSLLLREPIWGYLYRGKRLDCGTKQGWLRATITMAWEDPELKGILQEVLGDEA
ncbi:MAG TPA: UTP--glucose-1-phosphate uridylyltransferase GalU [Synergistaceae bacterium]|nr:UTP--glucose-1-phosphate uridylyltransferase GalU [Synergistaceae bacterium]HQF90771.1 UTP--glucose-1-phosphate uridylyltransferase GalU [Synergistaceae bacterium]HQH77891.1 UTP--glucose-1-phosphate uridylyltransferase GalU [Synergistaceae bacterium]HQK24035.1 UTP--glucose-1-phosphate uridylyltransferase GalU [Synergistaceae bacterium]